MSVDPLAIKMPEWSPYNYTFNNPLFFIDPDGRMPCPPGVDCGGDSDSPFSWANLEKKIEQAKDRVVQAGEDLYNWIFDSGTKAATFTDANDVTVLATTLAGDPMNIDGSDAGVVDIVFAGGGLFIPYFSGSSVRRALTETVGDASSKVAKTSLSKTSIGASGDEVLGEFQFSNGGTIDLLGNISQNGSSMKITNVIFYARDAAGNELKNDFGPRAMAQTFEEIKQFAKTNGATSLRLQFERAPNSSSENPGKSFDRIFNF